jgi:capsid portal protein
MSDKAERITVQIADDKQSIAINFLPASGATGSLNLTLDQFTALIQTFGKIRSQIVAGQEIPALKGETVNVAFNTRWHIQPEQLNDGSVLTFYHPSFGAVGFVVPRDQVPLMVRVLTKHLEIQPANFGKPN